MLLLSIGYLLAEAVFNAQLVNVAGGLDGGLEYLRKVEYFGRATSGIGASLLLADLLLPREVLKNKPRAVLYLGLVFLLAWPFVYFGQKIAIEKLLIEPSSAQQRQQAYFSQLLRSGLARNAINIEGLPYDPGKRLEAPERVFLSLFSGLVYADPNLVDALRGQRESIVSTYVRKRIYDNFDTYYGDYKRLRNNLRTSYTEYADGSKKYNAGVAKATHIADDKWRDLENEIIKGWNDYQKAMRAYEARAAGKAEALAPHLYRLFWDKGKAKPKQQWLIDGYNRRYDDLMKQYGLGKIPQSTWLVEQEGPDAGGMLQCGSKRCRYHTKYNLFTGEKQVLTDWPGHYRIVILKQMAPEFERETGYPMGIKTLVAFRAHPVTAGKVRKSAEGKGVILPASWRLGDRSVFVQAVMAEVRRDAMKQWRNKMARKGVDMPPNLPWGKFQQHPSIQEKIKGRMGEDFYVANMTADWNNAQFKAMVVEPNIRRQIARIIEYLDAELPQYSDGGQLAEKGKSALRSTLIPPISMVLSLALVLLTILKIINKAYQLVSRWRSYKAQVPWTASYKDYAVRGGLLAVAVTAFFSVPLLAFSSPYTDKGSTVGYFLSKLNEHSSPIFSVSLEWAMLTQPKVYPIGNGLERTLGLVDSLTPDPELLKVLDGRVVSMVSGMGQAHGGMAHAEPPDKLPLIIKANVDGARVRVMNIGPQYQEGMMLPSGKAYDVEVSKPGYVTSRRWVELNEWGGAQEFILQAE